MSDVQRVPHEHLSYVDQMRLSDMPARPDVTDRVRAVHGLRPLDAASVQQLCDEDDAAWDDFRAHHRPAWDDEGDVYGDPVGYGRTPNDDRLRAIFWLLVVPMYLVGMSILGWAVGTALREWLR